jgi:hypothetical protein
MRANFQQTFTSALKASSLCLFIQHNKLSLEGLFTQSVIQEILTGLGMYFRDRELASMLKVLGLSPELRYTCISMYINIHTYTC